MSLEKRPRLSTVGSGAFNERTGTVGSVEQTTNETPATNETPTTNEEVITQALRTSQRMLKKSRIDKAHIRDLAQDYVDHYNEWRKTQRRLIHLYCDTAILNNKMVCENCKKIVKVNMEIANDTCENPHATVNADGPMIYKCTNLSFTEYFMSLCQ